MLAFDPRAAALNLRGFSLAPSPNAYCCRGGISMMAAGHLPSRAEPYEGAGYAQTPAEPWNLVDSPRGSRMSRHRDDTAAAPDHRLAVMSGKARRNRFHIESALGLSRAGGGRSYTTVEPGKQSAPTARRMHQQRCEAGQDYGISRNGVYSHSPARRAIWCRIIRPDASISTCATSTLAA